MTFGQRLKQERERVGMTQTQFAAFAGASKKSQIDYEKDSVEPKASYFSGIAGTGVDVLYIITGKKADSHTKESMIEVYESAILSIEDVLKNVRSMP